MSSPTSGGAQVDVSGDGTLAYVPGGVASNLANATDWMTRNGQTSVLRAPRTQWANPRFSPDGQKLAVDSPDGRFVAYYYTEGGGTSYDVYVRPFPGPGGPWRVSTNGGMYPRWSSTAHQLLWIDVGQLKVMVAPFSVVGDAFIPGKPELWSPKGFVWIADGNSYYDLHPDGKRVAVASSAGQTVQDHVVVMSSFFDYLRTIAPGKK